MDIAALVIAAAVKIIETDRLAPWADHLRGMNAADQAKLRESLMNAARLYAVECAGGASLEPDGRKMQRIVEDILDVTTGRLPNPIIMVRQFLTHVADHVEAQIIDRLTAGLQMERREDGSLTVALRGA